MPLRGCEYCKLVLGVVCGCEGKHRIYTPALGKFVWACEIAWEHWSDPKRESERVVVPI